MAYVTVPKDLTKIKSKVMFNLIHVRYVYVVAGKQTRPFPAIRLS